MGKQYRGTSSAPLILGIIGFVLSLPAILCAGVCAVASAGIGTAGLVFFILAGIIGLIFGILAKSQPVISGIFLLVAAFFALLAIIFCPIQWFWGLIILILFLIGGIVSLNNKEEVTQN